MQGDQNCYESHEWNWQLYTKTGNQRMQANLYQEAQQAYQQAVDLAKSLLSQAKHTATHPDAIHVYVVSCHNLADCFLAMGDARQAEAILQQAYTEIIDTMNQSSFSKDLRFEALKALKIASCEMHSFYQQQNQLTSANKVMQDAIASAKVFLAQFQIQQIYP
ncbi:DUF2753 family protein [Fischerella thermalis]|uniref:Tetratricopeptide repeat protein n=1 Tax=Fischerella thermalis CCMEE 5318 TaxID=2019666 RepID=A0A2N6L3I2_9CYAN|nr:DUF2753 family protein [Fischerella thermalis]PMB14687.1 hypothetical protein CEN46_26560 [Fischerella thermalis CCMEE 5318]PMB39788.1 hypothetical protein CEN47_04395 [Fischerella thermalis CCMEE 5319]